MSPFIDVSGQGSTLSMFVIGLMVVLGMGGYALMSFAFLIIDRKIQDKTDKQHAKVIPLHPHENDWNNAEATLQEHKRAS